MQRLGGFDHAFAIRKEHWTVECAPTALTPRDDNAAPVIAAVVVKQKRLQQKQRTAKLADLLQQMVHFSKDANGNQLFVEYTNEWALIKDLVHLTTIKALVE